MSAVIKFKMSLLGKHFRPFCIQLARCGLPTKYVTGRAFATGQVCRLPVMHLNTNLKEQDIPADFERKLCEKIGEVLDKPLEVRSGRCRHLTATESGVCRLSCISTCVCVCV